MPDNSLRGLLCGLRRLTDHSGGLSDAELLERFVTARDEAAFEVLVWRHGPMILGVCRRLLRREQDVEDAFQATFLALVRKGHTIGRREAVGSWLYKVAYRTALAACSASARRAGREQPWVEQPAPDAPDDLLWRDLRSVLDREVMALPEKYRTPFLLCCLEGKSNEEAARQLGCARGTVLSRLARARERLRLRLARRGVTLTAGALALAAEEGLAAVSADLAGATVRAVLGGPAGSAAAGVSAHVAALTEGVLRAMFLTRLKPILAALLVAILAGAGAFGAAALGGTPAGGPPGGEEPRQAVRGKPVAPSRGAEPPKAEDPRKTAAMRVLSTNNLKQIGIALHNYHTVYGGFPEPAIYSKDGKPLLSWRVAILPFIEQKALYKQFKLDEPWDSPHNKPLANTVVKIFMPVRGVPDKMPGGTYYQAIVGKGAGFEPDRKLRVTDFTDGTTNTLLVVEAATLVPWTKPEDLPYAPNQALPRLGGQFGGDFFALIADGSVHLLGKKADPVMLRRAIERADGNPVDFDKLRAAGGAAPPPRPAPNLNDARELERAFREAMQRAEAARAEADVARARLEEQTAAAAAKVRQLEEENTQLRNALEQARRQLNAVQAELDRLRKQLGQGAKDRQ
ncbi:MAG: sigma-70 family RNA polymerase sigma factor [Gemmataceae bacterium]|nr:sigma-70 family RNA polymerase sigma factor [Gemmataceae bacterium]